MRERERERNNFSLCQKIMNKMGKKIVNLQLEEGNKKKKEKGI